MDDDDLTAMIFRTLEGDEQAIQKLWERYYQSLVRLARKHLAGSRRRVVDEEDVALSAFHSFCEGARSGRFPKLGSRDDLWKLLVTITARKAMSQLRHERRQKRGGGAVRGESVFVNKQGTDQRGLQDIMGESPTPAFAVQVAEEHQRLLSQLDESLRLVAQMKLEGYTNAEIAERIERTERTVERKLDLIRRCWSTDSTD